MRIKQVIKHALQNCRGGGQVFRPSRSERNDNQLEVDLSLRDNDTWLSALRLMRAEDKSSAPTVLLSQGLLARVVSLSLLFLFAFSLSAHAVAAQDTTRTPVPSTTPTQTAPPAGTSTQTQQ